MSIINLINTHPFLLYLIGKPKTGKSHMTKFIIKELMKNKLYDYVLVFCPSLGLSKDSSYDFIPSEFQYNKYSDYKIRNIMRLQKQRKEENKPNRCLLILDDIIGSINKNNKTLHKLITLHRHYNISIIISSQYMKGVDPVLRDCFNYLIIFKPSNYQYLNDYKTSWFYDVNNLSEHFSKYCNKQYRACFVNLDKSEKDRYISIKAPNIRPFKLKY